MLVRCCSIGGGVIGEKTWDHSLILLQVSKGIVRKEAAHRCTVRGTEDSVNCAHVLEVLYFFF